MVVRKYKQYNKPKATSEIVSPQKTIPSGSSITVSQPDGNGGYYIIDISMPYHHQRYHAIHQHQPHQYHPHHRNHQYH
jgi:hypothetical protein